MSDTTSTSTANSAPEPGYIAEDFDPNTGEVLDTPPQNPGALVIQDTISRLQSGNVNVFSTVVGDDFNAKLQVLGAVTNAEPIGDHIGEHIELENIVIQMVEIARRDAAGNVVTNDAGDPIMFWAPRVILLDHDGTAYYGISPVLAKAVETFIGVLKAPHTWPEPVGMKVLRQKARIGSFYEMKLDPRPKAAAKK